MLLIEREWMRGLETNGHGNLIATLSNISRILEHDTELKNIMFNELSGYFDTTGPLPWRESPGGWGQNDLACLETVSGEELRYLRPVKMQRRIDRLSHYRKTVSSDQEIS